MSSFDLQGHRSARGLKPENTLPSFEVALDLGVTSIETDVRLTCDGVPVLYHDDHISERHCRRLPHSNSPDPGRHPLISSLALAEIRGYRADRNPDPQRFPNQEASVTPLAKLFAERHDVHPYAVPTLADLFAFVQAYVGYLGIEAGKTEAQRERARDAVRLDLDLKRAPFRPEIAGDGFQGDAPGQLELLVVDAVRKAGMAQAVYVHSFDHRLV